MGKRGPAVGSGAANEHAHELRLRWISLLDRVAELPLSRHACLSSARAREVVGPGGYFAVTESGGGGPATVFGTDKNGFLSYQRVRSLGRSRRLAGCGCPSAGAQVG